MYAISAAAFTNQFILVLTEEYKEDFEVHGGMNRRVVAFQGLHGYEYEAATFYNDGSVATYLVMFAGKPLYKKHFEKERHVQYEDKVVPQRLLAKLCLLIGRHQCIYCREIH